MAAYQTYQTAQQDLQEYQELLASEDPEGDLAGSIRDEIGVLKTRLETLEEDLLLLLLPRDPTTTAA